MSSALTFYSGAGGGMTAEYLSREGKLTSRQRKQLRERAAADMGVSFPSGIQPPAKFPENIPAVMQAVARATPDGVPVMSQRQASAEAQDNRFFYAGMRQVPIMVTYDEFLEGADQWDRFLVSQEAKDIWAAGVREAEAFISAKIDAMAGEGAEVDRHTVYSLYSRGVVALFRSQAVDGEFEFEPMPSFYQKCRTTPHWRVAETLALTANLPSIGIDEEIQQDIAKEASWVAQEYTLTNGGLAGQTSRLKACWDERVKHQDKKEMDYEEVRDCIARTIYMNPAVPPPDAGDVMAHLTRFLPHVKNNSWTIKGDSDPGMQWRHFERERLRAASRSEVLLSDLLTTYLGMAWFVDRAMDATTAEEDILADIEMLTLNGVVEMKRKFEIIKRTKLNTKIRNIMVFNSWSQVMVGVAARTFGMPKFSLEHRSMSLYGFMPLYGGADDFMQIVIEMCEINAQPTWRTRSFFYSDNFYTVYFRRLPDGELEFEIASLDVSKMESSADSEEMAKCFAAYLDINGIHPGTYISAIITTMATRMITDSPFILGEITSTFPGMGSGGQATFGDNHLTSATKVETVEGLCEMHGPPPPGEVGLPDPHGDLGFTLEFTTMSNWPYEPGCNRLNNPIEYFSFTDAFPTDVDEYPPTVHLDLLGNDLQLVDIDGSYSWVSVLDYERLWKALVYRKKEVDTGEADDYDPNEHAFITNIINYTTMCGLFIAGGYGYLNTAAFCFAAASDLLEQIKLFASDNKNSPEFLSNVLDKIEQTVDAIYEEGDNEELKMGLAGAVVSFLSKLRDDNGDYIIDFTVLGRTYPAYEEVTMEEFFTRRHIVTRYHLSSSIRLKEISKEAKLDWRAKFDEEFARKRERFRRKPQHVSINDIVRHRAQGV